ncbi:cell wall-binding repeat-containing protein [Peterkaempfera bronchialis]|uniref:cell wall-binding repeat-containing protein n=1 Tax=Peterkaempfera bronchialis TaxID=2126346 RepID=UPI003C30A90D
MNHRLRRASVALASVLAVSAGTLSLTAGEAAAAGSWAASDGRLLGTDGSNLYRISPDGSGSRYLRQGTAPAWSPDGSRAALVDPYRSNELVTIRQDGAFEQRITQKNGGGAVSDPTFWYGGDSVVFRTGGRLRTAASDGSTWPQPLFAAKKAGCDSQPSGSDGPLLVFVRTGPDCSHTGAAAVWLYNDANGSFRKLAADATQPALSADATRVVFVRTVDGVRQLFSVRVDGTGLKQLTTDTTQHQRPSWSPKGDRIAYVATGTDQRHLELLDVATGAATAVPNSDGWTDVAWQPLRYNYVARVYGSGSVSTNVAASRWTWDSYGRKHVPGLLAAKSAVLVNGGSPSYALTASALAGTKQGPVLTTGAGSLSSAASGELKRVLRKGATVYLVGNTKVLSSKLSDQVKKLGYKPVRLSGGDRYAASVAVAKASTSKPQWVFLATGKDYHDALAAAAAAGSSSGSRAVVVLTDGRSLTGSVTAYLNKLSPKSTRMLPVGADARKALLGAYDHGKLPRWPNSWDYWYVGGSSHEAVAVNLANFWWSYTSTVGLAPGNDWQSGLNAGSAMSRFGPLLWSGTKTLPGMTRNYLINHAAGINSVAVISPYSKVPKDVVTAIGTAISADANWFRTVNYAGGAIPKSATTGAVARSATAGTESAPAPAPAPARGPVAPDLSKAQRLTVG